LSTIQKAFVFIVLVLALLTAAVNLVLFAQRTNWKEKSAATEKDLADCQAKATASDKASQTTISTNKSDILNLQTQVASLTTDLQNAKSDLESTRADKSVIEGLASELKAKVDILAKNMDALQQRMDELDKAKQAAEAKLEEEKTARQNAEEQLAIANRKDKDLSVKVDSFTEQLNARDEEIKNLTQKVNVMSAYAPQIGSVPTPTSQRIFGSISGISDDGTVVYFTVGGDDGVKDGMLFIVYKADGTYIAQAKIYEVSAKKSAARVIPPVVGTISEGDNVANK
jgi:predicted  nucleic acid-binding Zn-ribbon protein